MVQNLGIRQRSEAKERALSPFAARSYLSRGRSRPEPSCPIRTCFQRDRDRIIHSKAFRRLKHKTQVFVMPGDHFVTRLSHTLEVAQIARTIARALNLNEDLTEAIALGHDLGHTPFGHIGEEELDSLYPAGFRHYEQSLRVVDYLENEGQGLNLTWEVRHGIRHHSKGQVDVLDWSSTGILEADICKLSDMVAYVNHDAGDAVRGRVVLEEEMPEGARRVLGLTTASRVNTMVSDIIASSWTATGEPRGAGPQIRMGREVAEATNLMRSFLYERVYQPTGRSREAREARKAVRILYNHYRAHSEELPCEFAARDAGRRAVDYIAGMTDQFATEIAGRIKRNERFSK